MALLLGPLTILRHSVMAKSPVSINQYISHIPGCLPNTMGWEATKDQYHGGTLFVNHASGFIFIKHQVSLSAGETLIGRCQFEQYALQLSITIESYHAGNAPFSSSAFAKDFTACGQTISFSGVGEHHQNGTTKHAIKTITSWACTMMLHSVLMWPECSNLHLWPFAMQHTIYLWTHLPAQSSPHLSSIELFTQTHFSSYSFLAHLHVLGSLVFMSWIPSFKMARRLLNGILMPILGCLSKTLHSSWSDPQSPYGFHQPSISCGFL